VLLLLVISVIMGVNADKNETIVDRIVKTSVCAFETVLMCFMMRFLSLASGDSGTSLSEPASGNKKHCNAAIAEDGDRRAFRRRVCPRFPREFSLGNKTPFT
jgi:hypothetical protein